jgi:oxaloacetate decarboxylase alpha subunit
MKTPERKVQHRIPLRITDTTLRDAHQSLWATRMRTDDILKIIDVVDAVGYYSLEVWGGATFDVCLRFLRENPWERLRKIKARAKRTPLQMLLRGQNVVGYKNYPDDLLEHFVALACENGVDIFRIFDALNDTRNVEHAIECVKRFGGHAQGTLSYTISPVHTIEQYVRCAKEQMEVGIDSLCIKDMAGILSPIAAEKLVSALVREIDVPIQIHCHATSGMATASYVEAVRAGAGAIDCAISPMAGFQSQPPVETMLSIFEEMPYHAMLDMDALKKVRKFFADLKQERTMSYQQPDNIIDPDILDHHIPGGMISNLRSQLEQQNALDKLERVLEEIPRVRKELGYTPLVTPTSQIVGSQAVANVLTGKRYEIVPKELRNYVKGLYGRPPGTINPKIREKVLGSEEPITCRPADLLSPMLPGATEGVPPELIHNEEDIVSYCLFPDPALEFFKWRSMPIEDRPTPPAHLELQQEKDAAKEKKVEAPPQPQLAPLMPEEDYHFVHELLAKMRELNCSELMIRKNDLMISLKSSGGQTQPTVSTATTESVPAKKVPAKAPQETQPSAQAAPEQKKQEKQEKSAGPAITAPLNGTFYLSQAAGKPPFIQIGDTVEAGTTVCIVEAMKLFNEIKTTSKCKILDILSKHGEKVEKDQELMRIEKLS